MKIIFICSSLEPGKDGVGDYTRRLATEIIKQGHNAFIIALNDRFISETERIKQFSDNISVETLRISSVSKWTERIDVMNAFISKILPDWVSLQYVPYGFNKKGLPFSLPFNLQQLKVAKWHIMFHEIWLEFPEHHHLNIRCMGFCRGIL